jgi:hypothetical protein
MSELFRIDMLPAEQGDALWIEYGDSHAPHRVLYDGGTVGTWPALRERVAALPADDRRFELLVVSHIDRDHIDGTLPLLEDNELGAVFDDIWFNGYRHLPDTPIQTMGPVEGERLTTLLADRTWNAAFDGRAVVVPAEGGARLPETTLAGGLRLTILSPGPEQLARLKPEWTEAIQAHGLDPDVPATAPPELPAGIEQLGPDEEPDIEALARSRFKADTAKPNGTSIVVLAEFEGRSAILAADAFPAVVARSLERLLAESGADRLPLGAFKLPHHGSNANIDLALLELVEAREYLFSSNGKQTRHPHLESVARVLHSEKRPRLWFNYLTSFNEVWTKPEVVARFGYEERHPEDGEEGIAVDVPRPH